MASNIVKGLIPGNTQICKDNKLVSGMFIYTTCQNARITFSVSSLVKLCAKAEILVCPMLSMRQASLGSDTHTANFTCKQKFSSDTFVHQDQRYVWQPPRSLFLLHTQPHALLLLLPSSQHLIAISHQG